MDLFLKTLGVIALTIIVLVAGIILLYWRKLRRIAKGVGRAFPTPSTIDLNLDSDPTWLEHGDARRDLATLESCGYVRGPAYIVEGMFGVGLASLHHPATGAFGCYYRHRTAGHWTDLCVDFADGLELTICNAPKGQQLDTRENTEKVFLRGETPAALHERLLERIAGRTVKPRAPEDFKTAFIATYAKDMAWRNAKGGISPEEFGRIAAGHKNLTDEQRTEAFKESKLRELRRWSEEGIRAFAQSTTLSVAEWKRYEHRMVIFHESFHPRAYLEYLTNNVALGDEVVSRFRQALDAGLSLRELLERIAAETGHEFIRLGAVDQPMKVDIYGIKFRPENVG